MSRVNYPRGPYKHGPIVEHCVKNQLIRLTGRRSIWRDRTPAGIRQFSRRWHATCCFAACCAQ